MTQHLEAQAREALATLVHELRPDWDTWLIGSVLQSHALTYPAGDLAVAAIRWASDPTSPTPKGIVWTGRHWHGLESSPAVIRSGPRCTTCGKVESRCLTERPGPDDHAFEVRS